MDSHAENVSFNTVNEFAWNKKPNLNKKDFSTHS